ncbi:hypothetical protein PPEP_a2158 [Pseudoalteromonas peptidolytica F12-50-A1]|uniref:Uncharacterized protein n=1 Tax=Pseudoalteromonas peptidolytica F12-50-A1 TaxID=1315280 RepID=A0A8I0MZ54_9GAMM|nr:hypothetical protein [Pseudoalteromonas peptidolytica F12-50-A1]
MKHFGITRDYVRLHFAFAVLSFYTVTEGLPTASGQTDKRINR